ncbi:MAG: protein CapI [Alphaproteobacteria bacterium]|nr:protein CapI [Alphaproteobacteria bacterium]
MTIVVTGAAGFVGFHLSAALLKRGETVLGVDNFDPYYSVELKRARAAELARQPGFRLIEADIGQADTVKLIQDAAGEITGIANMAANPGVRASDDRPFDFIASNIGGELCALELARHAGRPVPLVYASTSAVYGASEEMPFSPNDRADRPKSLYGATKRAAELISLSYASRFGIGSTALRFFTVYGPWGRPDMATWKFTKALFEGEKIELYNFGRMTRGFTYVEDTVQAVLLALEKPAAPGEHRTLNVGSAGAETLERYLAVLERAVGRQAEVERVAAHPAEMFDTVADISETERVLGWRPTTTIDVGLPKFVEWYRAFHKL